MHALIIETSGESGFIGLLESDILLAIKTLPPQKEQSKYLLTYIQDLLTQERIQLKNLSLIAVSHGPGLFTGIRVGLITAKTLSYALDLPLITFSSLERFIPQHEGTFATLIDAKSQGLYAIKGIRSSAQVTFTTAPRLLKEEDLSSHLEDIQYLISPHPEAILSKSHGLKIEKPLDSHEHLCYLIESKFLNEEFECGESAQALYLS